MIVVILIFAIIFMIGGGRAPAISFYFMILASRARSPVS
jgi:hypothetical protein